MTYSRLSQSVPITEKNALEGMTIFSAGNKAESFVESDGNSTFDPI